MNDTQTMASGGRFTLSLGLLHITVDEEEIFGSGANNVWEG